MPHTLPSEAPSGDLPFLGRYLGVLLLALVAMVAAGWALAMAGIALPFGAAAILPPIAAALHCGQHWGRVRGTVPGGRVAWRWALVAALVYLALLIVLAVPFVLPALATIMPFVLMILGGTVLMTILINRFFLVIGARSGVARGGRG
ncbi:ABZJ_00895 family protein [Jannaschia formosa]|uniref:ABZJ_00895 family protein n=1 Tax=Jannaschia formosa TaxID=2259592 RepID=UPI000E1C00DE|nr:ABZJ_00895 family protein [Jannaschia formosa]TFL16826.1 hypothetical protein DR046_18220 [Jannaschia formosa]